MEIRVDPAHPRALQRPILLADDGRSVARGAEALDPVLRPGG